MKKLKAVLTVGLMAVTMVFTALGATACRLLNGEFSFTEEHDGMNFKKESYDDDDGNKIEYYAAGSFCYTKRKCETYFIPASIDNIPVRRLGYEVLFNTVAGRLRDHEELSNLYIPGSVQESGCGGEHYIESYLIPNEDGSTSSSYGRLNLNIYYCGRLLYLYYIGGTNIKNYYVSAEKYEEFLNYESPSISSKPNRELKLEKANVSYRLNAEEMDEYYYVDYVEYGEKIQNIPPEPERKGYEFEGWYTEENCENKWNFEGDIIPALSDGTDFCELKLFAKWQKK